MRDHLRRLVLVGAAVGVVFGTWNLIATWVDPLAEDSPAALLLFYGPMFAIWAVAGFRVQRHSGRLVDAAAAGAVVALATFVVFDVATIARVNLFLDSLTPRADWQNLAQRFEASGYQSFRTFVNSVYATGAPFKILVATVIGAVMGSLGGLVGSAAGAARPRTPQGAPR
jgi:hypothetical protein